MKINTFSVKSINGPLKFPKVTIDPEKPNPPVGVSEISWSFDSNFLATKNGKKYKIKTFIFFIFF